MAWVRLEDDFADHRKILAAGPRGVCLWVCGLAYANRRPEHDGFIPAAKVLTLYPMPAPRTVAERLVEVGLWEAVEGGYRIHDYHDYQPTAEHVMAVRAVRADAGRRGGRRSGQVRCPAVTTTPRASPEGRAPEANAKQIASQTGSKREAKSNPGPGPGPGPGPELLPNGPGSQDGPWRPGGRRGRRPPPGGGVTVAVGEAYSTAYAQRYGKPPVMNARVRGQLAALVGRLGATEAPDVAAFFVTLNRSDYVRALHPVGLLLRDCEGLRTQWANGRVVTDTAARQADQTATNRETLRVLLADREAREAKKPP